MKNQLFDLPINSEDVIGILNSNKRTDFLNEYPFFAHDGNKKAYERWILDSISTSKNDVLEDIFKLAGREYLHSPKMLELGFKILSGRYSYFTKLECLVYYLRISNFLDRDLFVQSANVAIHHTKNDFVKFQANLNLAKYNEDNITIIKKWLLKSTYPTLFYRVKNLLWLYPKEKRVLINSVLQDTLNVKEFSNDVKQEISSTLNHSEHME